MRASFTMSSKEAAPDVLAGVEGDDGAAAVRVPELDVPADLRHGEESEVSEPSGDLAVGERSKPKRW